MENSRAIFVPYLVGLALAFGVLGVIFAYSEWKMPAEEVVAVDTFDAFADVEVAAKAAIVVDLTTGTVLYEKNADAQLPLASLTKVPLVLAVSEVLRGDDTITIPYTTSYIGSAERLERGEVWRVEDLIDYTLIASSNDGAAILAAAANSKVQDRFPTAPEDSATLWRMNSLAADLSLRSTYFLNVSGLDLSPTQSGAYGSARDMAKLFGYAASASASLFASTAAEEMRLTAASGQAAAAVNTNEAQGDITGLILGKTGYTDLAGGNLAVVFDVGLAHPVVVVVLGSTRDGRFMDVQKLVTAARASVTHETAE